MKIVKGSKIEELDRETLIELSKNYTETILDIGTGDGRFVFKHAKQNPSSFYVGLDPNQKQLEIYSKKINKFRLQNALLVLGSIEKFPKELEGIFNKVYINFPWGSLLGGIANVQENVLENIAKSLKTKGVLQITFGYSSEAEPSEVDRLQLESINRERIENTIIPALNKLGFEIKKIEEISKELLAEVDSTWGKKLAFGQDRKMFSITLAKA